MAGFNSPSILFLNTWDKPERDWNGNLFRQALASGYTRYVELYAGAFANCMVAVENGWKPEQIEACDVWAYTAALGYAYSGTPLTEMRATVDGSPVPLSGNAADDAATVIMAQYRMRLSKHEDVDYYRELLADLDINDSEHVGQLRERIASNMVRLGGVKYEANDPMKYAERIMDDPHTIVFANPPTYPGAYEKFFDTGGRFQWAEPEYNVFNAPVDIPKLCKLFDGRKALLICQQQQTPGNAATASPVYARRLGLDSVIYMNSNRPDEVKRLVGGNMVTVAASKSAEIPIPILPRDHRITERSKIEIVPLRDSAAQDSYLQVMRHRISGNVSSMCVLVLIDGYVAGIIGYGLPNFMYTTRYAVLRQAFGVSHERYRLTKLVTQMDNVDDLLLSGLDQDSLPHVEPQQVNLNGLNVKYEYKNVEFLFLTREYEELEQFVDDCNADMLGLVPMELYDEFVHQVTAFASRNGIKNMAAAVSKLIEIARKDAEEE